MKRTILTLFLMLFIVGPNTSQAQSYINQSALAEILTRCTDDIVSLPAIDYEYYYLFSSRNNNVWARNTFFKVIGDGDVDLGKKRSKLVELITRKLVPKTVIGDTLVIPSKFDLDFCAYSPFPLFYPKSRGFKKLFIIDKSIQAWAAYEKGKLIRWGIVNTGAKDNPTPNGRYNFNWKTEYRVSSLSPPGEPWEMYWVFNFYDERGIHIHQYPMPTGGPTSHGCVRLVEEDAKWIYDWADSWTTTKGNGFGSSQGKIKAQGTTVLVIGEDPVGVPQPFKLLEDKPVLVKVKLPDHPLEVPPGTSQQKYFDSIRGTN